MWHLKRGRGFTSVLCAFTFAGMQLASAPRCPRPPDPDSSRCWCLYTGSDRLGRSGSSLWPLSSISPITGFAAGLMGKGSGNHQEVPGTFPGGHRTNEATVAETLVNMNAFIHHGQLFWEEGEGLSVVSCQGVKGQAHAQPDHEQRRCGPDTPAFYLPLGPSARNGPEESTVNLSATAKVGLSPWKQTGSTT